MQRAVQGAGYAALVAMPIVLLARAVLAPDSLPVVKLGFGGGLVLVGSVAIAVERGRVFGDVVELTVDDAALADVVAVVAAAGTTYGVSVHLGLGPVVASALVGLVAGATLPEVDTAAYCGSFVGMASPSVFPSVVPVLVAGLAAGAAFVAARDVFAGVGGKLGTLALFGCVTAAVVSGAEYATGPTIGWTSVVYVVPVAVLGATATVVTSERFGLGPVVASALVGLVAGTVFPIALSDIGEVSATVAFCSSFVGMSSGERLRNVTAVGVAGAVCGITFVAVAPAFAGAGGKLGTTAFIACLGCVGADRLRRAAGVSTPS